MKKSYIMSPGPTSVPPQVSLAEAKPIIHHRTPAYEEIFKQVNDDLKYLFQTSNDVLTFASSGTGAMEASIVNLLSAGDTALVIRGGKFGERWGNLCEAYGVNFIPIDVEWGTAVDPALIKEKLNAHPEIKAVFTTLCETSTATLTDIAAIGNLVKDHQAVLVVDAISAMGVDKFLVDEWNVDLSVVGSQKGLMIPPGLAFASVSEKAWALTRTSTLPKFYFSFKAAKKSLPLQTPYTPAVSLIYALAQALQLIREETMEKVWLRHDRLARGARAGVRALGLELLSKSPANGVTAILAPNGINGDEIKKRFEKDHGIIVAEGQDHLKGKIVRIAHMGYADTFDVITTISALEMILNNLGYQFEPGSGIRAAEEVLMKG